MAGAKNHDYHILPPSIWPMMCSLAAFGAAAGGIMWMRDAAGGPAIFGVAMIALLFFMGSWWADVVREAHAGDHTPVVQLHLRYGMILFIASEVMFFVGWFWSWFDFSLFPVPLEITESGVANLIGQDGANALLSWPPKGLEVIDPFHFPLLNTFILLLSGTTVTWAHHALIHGERGGEMKGLWGLIGVGEHDGLKKGLWLTIILGLIFSAVQAYEYAHAPFPFGQSNYSSAFYMATGFHGFHVIIGTLFLMVCLYRAYAGHFTPRQHFGFEAAAWYWHFVDVVWLFLFVVVYVWGGWGAEIH
ncbi:MULTISPECIES: cytochrome c oxidase subunit 3 [unclassified Sphingomonas]|jgi:cytochrome c oxidase subunit 3|uniref:cytochrome c oxidase subunit 3 n=1 Tax=unclassified Sphingomonas TaxID=196159 RepID=UPI0008296986|nr:MULTISPECIES: cytochrome c oxidase subunit 3 [unclassified Sphingomonas]MCH4894872.1 cytochrome c oxidase subunit 3 [Sphingomonas sp. SFZ2018-12]